MSEQLKQLLDQSHCLSKRQIKDYASGTMTREEAHAVEQHLNACPFCSAAVDGMTEFLPESADALVALNSIFLKDHFGTTPHTDVHLNALAPAMMPPAQPAPAAPKKRRLQYTPWQMTGIAAAILLFFAAIWYIEFGSESHHSGAMADGVPAKGKMIAEGEKSSSAPATLVAPSPSSDKAATDLHEQKQEALRQTEDASLEQPVAEPVEQPQPATGKVVENKDAGGNASGYAAPPPLATGNMARTEPDALKNAAEERAEKTDKKAAYKGVAVEATDSPYSKEVSAVAVSAAPNPLGQGKALFESKNYSAALQAFQKGMNSGDQAQRQEATYYAARCYLYLGQKTPARRLLQQLSESDGPQKKAAGQLLEELDKENAR